MELSENPKQIAQDLSEKVSSRQLFDLAHSALKLNDETACITAYSCAFGSVINNSSEIYPIDFASEIAIVDRLNKLNSFLKSLVKLYLNIAAYNNSDLFSNSSDQNNLEPHQIRRELIKAPVIIVAGGSSRMQETKTDDYRDLLCEMLKGFKGTIISGGTSVGIPGLLGEVKGEMGKQSILDFELIAYLPKVLPENVHKSVTYDHFYETDFDRFSVLDVLSYWCDLVCSGIKPADVILIGIDGGDLAAIEYRIALSLGAKVCLVTDSGRAVSDLLNDEFWKNHPNLLEIPNDPLNYLALINQLTEITTQKEKTDPLCTCSLWSLHEGKIGGPT